MTIETETVIPICFQSQLLWKIAEILYPCNAKFISSVVRQDMFINRLRANFTKLSNILKQVVGKLPTSCLSVSDHFVGLALKRLKYVKVIMVFIKVFLQLSTVQTQDAIIKFDSTAISQIPFLVLNFLTSK